MANAKAMSRSRNQLQTAYAPESFFTFEGGVGACIAHSSAGEAAELSAPTRDQIYERMLDFAHAWYDSAMRLRVGQPSKPPVLPVHAISGSQACCRSLAYRTLSSGQAGTARKPTRPAAGAQRRSVVPARRRT